MQKRSKIKFIHKIKKSVQSFFRYFRFINILRKFKIKSTLVNNGYCKIRGYHIFSWKKYNNFFFLFFKCRKENVDYLVKVTNKVNKEFINTIEKINNINEDFLVQTTLFEKDNTFFITSKYIKHYDFSDIKYIKSKEIIDNLLGQLNFILDSFYTNKIIHFDLNQKNIIIEKKTWKIKVIDYDTLYYGQKDFKINFQSFLHTKEGTVCIYDDVYTVVYYLNLFKNELIYNSKYYTELNSKIGRFIYKIKTEVIQKMVAHK